MPLAQSDLTGVVYETTPDQTSSASILLPNFPLPPTTDTSTATPAPAKPDHARPAIAVVFAAVSRFRVPGLSPHRRAAGNTMWPLMKELQGTPMATSCWTTGSGSTAGSTIEGNVSTSKNTNTPDLVLDPAQQRRSGPGRAPPRTRSWTRCRPTTSTGASAHVGYGIDYRYITAGGWFSDQLLKHNNLYGWDPTEQYFDVYIPGLLEGTDHPRRPLDRLPGHRNAVLRRQLHGQPFDPVHLRHLHPDRRHVHLEAQRPVDGPGAFTRARTWPPGTRAPSPRPAFGLRWVSKDNNDAFYTWLNAINDANSATST